MNKIKNDPVVDKLDKILKVLSLQVAPDKSITERAALLNLAGLSNQEISEVLNIPITSVRTLLSRTRKKRV